MTIPERLTVREIVTVATPGCRVKKLVMVTALVDSAAYAKADIADLYHDYWHAELDLRSIKRFPGMELLR